MNMVKYGLSKGISSWHDSLSLTGWTQDHDSFTLVSDLGGQDGQDGAGGGTGQGTLDHSKAAQVYTGRFKKRRGKAKQRWLAPVKCRRKCPLEVFLVLS